MPKKIFFFPPEFQGYQHWQGELAGRLRAGGALLCKGLRAGFKNRYLRTVLYLAWIPALALVVTLCVWGMVGTPVRLHSVSDEHVGAHAGPKDSRCAAQLSRRSLDDQLLLFLWIEMGYAMLLILMVGPNLISQGSAIQRATLYFRAPCGASIISSASSESSRCCWA